MLTVKEMFLAADVASGASLLLKFPFHPLYLSSVSRAYEQQTRIYFVSLVSVRALISDTVKSYSDFVSACQGPLGQMNASEVSKLKQDLEGQGLYLRYISTDLRRAALVGSVYSLSAAKGIPIDPDNFIKIKSDPSGADDIATGSALLGGAMTAAGAATLDPPLFWFGLAVTLGSGNYFLTKGILKLLYGTPPQPSPPKQEPSSENSDTPNDPNDFGDPTNGDDIEVPKAVAIGDEEPGIDVDGLVQQLGTHILNDILDDLPLGWDADAGSPIPTIGPPPSDGGSGDDDGGGFPSIPIWG